MKRRIRVKRSFLIITTISVIIHSVIAVIIGGVTVFRHDPVDELGFGVDRAPETKDVVKVKFPVVIKESVKVEPVGLALLDDFEGGDHNFNVAPVPGLHVKPRRSSWVFGSRNYETEDERIRGLGGIFRRDSVERARSTVDFFGVKGRGARLMFVIDASNYMLVDERGGIQHFGLIKRKVLQTVRKLNLSSSFNVVVYSGKRINMFRQELVPADEYEQNALEHWLAPINDSVQRLGPGRNNYKPRELIEPMGRDVSQFARAIQAGMEQEVDTIFVLSSGWQWMGRKAVRNESSAYHAQSDEVKPEVSDRRWRESVIQARAWLETENKLRQELGRPEHIVHSIHSVVAERSRYVEKKQHEKFTDEDVLLHIENSWKRYYKRSKRPVIHVSLYFAENEPNADNKENRMSPLAQRNKGKFYVIRGPFELEGFVK